MILMAQLHNAVEAIVFGVLDNLSALAMQDQAHNQPI